MTITPQQIELILEKLRQKFPDWNGFDHPGFVKEEIGYKREAVKLAQSLLGKEELQSLIDAHEYDEFLARLKKVGESTNLLYRSIPNSSDLNILFREELDKRGFCQAVFDLLWSDASSGTRLHRYLQGVAAHDLPNKWTFPTYFLFLCRPETELFIKPYSVMRPFLKLIGSGLMLPEKPEATAYESILAMAQELKAALHEYSPHPYAPQDMVDIQSLMWVCAKADGQHSMNFQSQDAIESETDETPSTTAPTKVWKISPGKKAMYWRECLDGGFICIGWDELGDLTSYVNKEDFIEGTRAKFETLYSNPGKRSTKVNEVWAFRTLRPGDVVVANKGTTEILGVGDVVAPGYKWRPERPDMKNTVAVKWRPFARKTIPAQTGWPFVTVARIKAPLYQIITGETIIDDKNDETEDPPKVIARVQPPYVEPPFASIQQHIEASGMRIDEQTLRRYHLSLKTRGFVILSGLSGAGKTWLARLYAQAVDAECEVVPVAPNWTANEDLLGFWNPINETYQDTQFSRFLRAAADEYESAMKANREAQPFHLVLDEMNLARVEYYFAKFLSTLELRAQDGTVEVELGPDESVVLPPNLFFIGTVNMDETTHGFADKVYDRAQLLEIEVSREMMLAHLDGKVHGQATLEIWDAIHHVAPFAFRVLDEIESYLAVAAAMGVEWRVAFDEQVLHKILPKFKGTDHRIKEALEKIVEIAHESLPLTHRKSRAMLERFDLSGFVSFF